MAALAGRGSRADCILFRGLGPELFEPHFLRYGIRSHIPKASRDSAGSGSFGGGTGKGRGSHEGGGERLPLRQSIVLSFLQQDARSTTEWALWLRS